jgi:hypothetical protein
LCLDDLEQRAVRAGDEPAVAAGHGRLEAEHHDGGAGAAGLEHGVEGLGADEGGVAVEHDGVAGEAVERRGGLEHGVAGAELFRLVGDADVLVDLAGGGGDRLGFVAGHHHDALGLDRAGGGERMGKQRRARDPVQHLRQVRVHPGALTGGEADDGG